jgi:hypothetical protein
MTAAATFRRSCVWSTGETIPVTASVAKVCQDEFGFTEPISLTIAPADQLDLACGRAGTLRPTSRIPLPYAHRFCEFQAGRLGQTKLCERCIIPLKSMEGRLKRERHRILNRWFGLLLCCHPPNEACLGCWRPPETLISGSDATPVHNLACNDSPQVVAAGNRLWSRLGQTSIDRLTPAHACLV